MKKKKKLKTKNEIETELAAKQIQSKSYHEKFKESVKSYKRQETKREAKKRDRIGVTNHLSHPSLHEKSQNSAFDGGWITKPLLRGQAGEHKTLILILTAHGGNSFKIQGL